MNSEKSLEELEIIERYIILLLGVINKPIPSEVHLQKELFILTQVNPIIKNRISFEKHYYGPYSEVLSDLIRHPYFHSKPYSFNQLGELELLENGRKIYNNLLRQYKDNKDFKRFLISMKLIRKMYEKLNIDELLFLIYSKYKDYIKRSDIVNKLFSKKRILAKQLLNKGVITLDRYKELVNLKWE
ncbi:MAG: hypothetical protein ACTSVV_11305 [Promethearchaeota archaeon]